MRAVEASKRDQPAQQLASFSDRFAELAHGPDGALAFVGGGAVQDKGHHGFDAAERQLGEQTLGALAQLRLRVLGRFGNFIH
jgi:hypothetical protein